MIKAVVTERNLDGIQYFDIKECGEKLDSTVLSWLVLWALNTNKNIRYEIDGGWTNIGSKAFLAKFA